MIILAERLSLAGLRAREIARIKPEVQAMDRLADYYYLAMQISKNIAGRVVDSILSPVAAISSARAVIYHRQSH
ncbi:TPA: hypothetical protein ACGBUC_002929 [Klebsiella variicola]|uniref:hypothetical protein n=1 Tax=Klebsiella variicola TaxID=244366 RepID=UPI0010546A09|nr:hypothetical protein [Klebsiella variicola]